jgi:hypothetical protein
LHTFTPDASVELKPDSIPGVADLILSYHSKTRPIVVVLDEFQDILNLGDARETLALLRSKIQFQSDIPYIFAGSIRNKFDGIFNDPESAFLKSAIPIQVGPIDKDRFQKFIINKFRIGKRRISADSLKTAIKTADRFSKAGWPGAHVVRFSERLGNYPGLFGSKGPKQAYWAQNYILL